MDRLRVLTLNIWNNMGPWEDRRRLIRAELERLSPDVVGLQEVLRLQTSAEDQDDDQARQIAEGLGYETVFGVAKEMGGGLDFGNALLTRLPVRRTDVVALPRGDRGEEARSVLWAELEAPFGMLPVFVTHLNWKLHEGSVRLRQVQAIADLVQEIAPVHASDYPPVLMGDLNAEPGSDEIRFLQGLATIEGRSVFFADCWHWAGDGGPGATFDRRNAYAALSREPPRRIDYVFVRGPDKQFRGEPLSCRIVMDEPEGDVWPSDHFGVLAELSVPAR